MLHRPNVAGNDAYQSWPFTPFGPLYEDLSIARNDAMRSGAYARRATTKAIQSCIGLEEALMNDGSEWATRKVVEFMVKWPVIVEHCSLSREPAS